MKQLDLAEMKQIQMDMLVEFDRVCSEYGFRYSLCGGTLLGAIRHNGYIPWDDDIDVMMPRPDFEQLMQVKPKAPYYFQSPLDIKTSGPYIYSFGKMYHTNTKLIEFPSSKKIVSHVYLDIFPIDGVPSDSAEHLRLYRKVHKYVLLNRAMEISYYNRDNLALSRPKRLGWQIIWIARNVLPRKFAMKKAWKLATKYPFDQCKEVGSLVAGYGPQEKFPVSAFSMRKKDFEGIDFSIISGYDIYLRKLYGDYMIPPPKEKRISQHDAVAFDLTE